MGQMLHFITKGWILLLYTPWKWKATVWRYQAGIWFKITSIIYTNDVAQRQHQVLFWFNSIAKFRKEIMFSFKFKKELWLLILPQVIKNQVLKPWDFADKKWDCNSRLVWYFSTLFFPSPSHFLWRLLIKRDARVPLRVLLSPPPLSFTFTPHTS